MGATRWWSSGEKVRQSGSGSCSCPTVNARFECLALAQRTSRIQVCVDPDHWGGTPLYAAACFNHKDVAELLLAHKADVNGKGKEGWTSLHVAAFYGHKAVAE